MALVAIAAVALLLTQAAPAGAETAVVAANQDSADQCANASPPMRLACQITAGLDDPSRLIGGVVSGGAEAALRAMVEWVVGGATWLLAQLVGLLDSSTSPELREGWFTVAYGDMVAIAALMILPLLLLSVMQAVIRQSIGQLTRAAFVYVPLASIGMFAAVAVVGQLVLLADGMTGWIGRSTGTNLTAFAANVAEALATTGMAATGPGGGAALPGFATVLAAGVIGFASFVIWVLLVLRQAAVYVAVLFLPLGFAALVWPATAHWLRRLVEGLVAIIMSKFVIVAVMALASGALNAVADEGFPVLVSGGALLLMAAFAPFVLLRLIPVFESGLANQLEGTTNARTSPVPGPTAHGVYRGVQQARAASAARGVGRMASAGGRSMAAAGGVVTAGAGLVAAGVAKGHAAASTAARGTAEVGGGRDGDGTGTGERQPRAAGAAGGEASMPVGGGTAGAMAAGGDGPSSRGVDRPSPAAATRGTGTASAPQPPPEPPAGDGMG